ncbi:MAG: 50S ribosomal protein L30e [Methanoculleaceae archaeon]
MDFNTTLRRAIKTGSVTLGQNSTMESVLEGRSKLVVIARNCPDEFRKFIEVRENVPVYTYEGTGIQLGRACGKPFVVSALSIEDPGDSNILNIQRARS